jgi:hypothetical protein
MPENALYVIVFHVPDSIETFEDIPARDVAKSVWANRVTVRGTARVRQLRDAATAAISASPRVYSGPTSLDFRWAIAFVTVEGTAWVYVDAAEEHAQFLRRRFDVGPELITTVLRVAPCIER